MKGFWKDLPRPIWALAPMEDVTDTVFRRIISSLGKPDVLFTEFISARGVLNLASLKSQNRLVVHPQEKGIPLVAQIWGTEPEVHYKAVLRLKEMGFSGIDINMGCPVKKITKTGGCSALILNPSLAVEIIQAVQEGAGDLPVSVKTRIGFHKIETEQWISLLLEQDLDALTVHGRIAAQQSEGPCHWDQIRLAVRIRDRLEKDTLLLGNGDLLTHQDIQEKLELSQGDGVMVGRGVFSDPCLFSRNKDYSPFVELSLENKIQVLLRHLDLYEEQWDKKRNFEILKKFFKIYTQGFSGDLILREQLMETHSYEEARMIIKAFVNKN